MVKRNRPRGRSPGQIESQHLRFTRLKSPRRDSPGVAVRIDRSIWKAPRDLPGPLPHDRSVRFDVYTAADNVRRFVPCADDGRELFIARAFQYGHSLLARDHKFDWETWCEYLLAKLAFDRLQSRRERLRCRFKSAADLDIRPSLRFELGRNDLLPTDVGWTASGQGERWCPFRVVDEGHQAAHRDGLGHIGEPAAVNLGLLEAARLNPLYVAAPGEVESLVRLSVFDLSRLESQVSEFQRDAVQQHLHDLVRQHLADDRQQFMKWFAGGHNNLVKSIANRVDATGCKLGRAAVNRALNDLGWYGYLLLGECIEAFARAFARALPRSLSPQEEAYFAATYYRQPYLGGLPLVLLLDRSDQIQPIISELWENPDDPQTIATLHQVLRYYAEMVPLSREAGRLIKSNRPGIFQFDSAHEEENNLPAGANKLPDNCVAKPLKSEDRACDSNPLLACQGNGSLLGEVFLDLLERRNVRCSKCPIRPQGILVGNSLQPGEPFRLEASCEVHGKIEVVEISWRELEVALPLFVPTA